MASNLLRNQLLRKNVARSTLSRIQARASSNVNYQYVPGGPILRGGVNDPTPFPTPSRSHGSHHWAFERLLSAALVPLTGAAFVTSGTPYPILDGILGVSLIIHSHIGFDSAVVDYLHTRKFPILGQIVKWGLRVATAGVLVGVYQFNTNDIGLTELIRRVWIA
ncbi:mitochondrial inner membrane protein [Sistotremastrum niveocremeum HHB9708]|uniref:Succinate dehydrogenase [ubiquinone] cytochrome b small subunit n=2 Tax=Sistotremastraceae TaxID=3402574 RepID=A0A164T0U5_9AGAM|nr:mitochondrial inner membrane protein [Sistotremastrum niveocremeum HHB9708]KZT38805.1 succinate dehydrogenase cytochrome b small subunit precursor [Sistotremastrum suecicum HHB10207 ss-3]